LEVYLSFLKNKPYRDKKYLKYISRLPCVSCGIDSDTVIPHHLIGVGQGKMGGKASDKEAMPLCFKCHYAIHTDLMNKEIQHSWIEKTLQQAKQDGFFRDNN